MTDFTLKLSQIDEACKHRVGGKAYAVAKMSSNKLKVPKSLCITTDTFEAFIEHEGLRHQILMEYYRKRFEDMRWEEIWDLSLRIKNMFLKTPFPSEIDTHLNRCLPISFRTFLLLFDPRRSVKTPPNTRLRAFMNRMSISEAWSRY